MKYIFLFLITISPIIPNQINWYDLEIFFPEQFVIMPGKRVLSIEYKSYEKGELINNSRKQYLYKDGMIDTICEYDLLKYPEIENLIENKLNSIYCNHLNYSQITNGDEDVITIQGKKFEYKYIFKNKKLNQRIDRNYDADNKVIILEKKYEYKYEKNTIKYIRYRINKYDSYSEIHYITKGLYIPFYKKDKLSTLTQITYLDDNNQTFEKLVFKYTYDTVGYTKTVNRLFYSCGDNGGCNKIMGNIVIEDYDNNFNDNTSFCHLKVETEEVKYQVDAKYTFSK